jgi:hypothetical protein
VTELEILAEPFGSIDLMDPHIHAGNPWPIYDWLREEGPMYWDAINEQWCVSGYDDIVADVDGDGVDNVRVGNTSNHPDGISVGTVAVHFFGADSPTTPLFLDVETGFVGTAESVTSGDFDGDGARSG